MFEIVHNIVLIEAIKYVKLQRNRINLQGLQPSRPSRLAYVHLEALDRTKNSLLWYSWDLGYKKISTDGISLIGLLLTLLLSITRLHNVIPIYMYKKCIMYIGLLNLRIVSLFLEVLYSRPNSAALKLHPNDLRIILYKVPICIPTTHPCPRRYMQYKSGFRLPLKIPDGVKV